MCMNFVAPLDADNADKVEGVIDIQKCCKMIETMYNLYNNDVIIYLIDPVVFHLLGGMALSMFLFN